MIPTFSYYNPPVQNPIPALQLTLVDVYNYIRSDSLKQQTQHLRTLTGQQARQYKSTAFPYVTYGGIFTRRKLDALQQPSQLIHVDIDHVNTQQLIQPIKQLFFQPLMINQSVSGNGIKIIYAAHIKTPQDYTNMYHAIATQFNIQLNVKVDPACSDISRACFLNHDPNAWLNPNYNTIIKQFDQYDI